MMKGKFLLVLGMSMVVLNLAPLPVLSKGDQRCEQYEEIFTFQLQTYPMKHQGGAILNISVAYRLTPEAITAKKYPNFVPIRKDIDNYLVNYQNESDYWETVNSGLVKFVLEKYPQMSSVRIEMGVMPTIQWPFNRSSIVKSTRPQSCPLSL